MPSRGEDILKGFQVYPFLKSRNYIFIANKLRINMTLCRLNLVIVKLLVLIV